MQSGEFDNGAGSRNLLIMVVGVLVASVFFSWIKESVPQIAGWFVPREFLESPASSLPAERLAVAPAAGLPLNINTADAAALQQLPGIGPVLSQRIIDYRQQQGDFKTKDELMKVKGIGEKTLARFADRIVLE